MIEDQIRRTEQMLVDASAHAAAAIAIAAICRIGELGHQAGREFAMLAQAHRDAACEFPAFDQGCELIDDAIAIPDRIIQ